MAKYTTQLYLENVRIALTSLRANKVRSFLTVIGTTIGVFAVIMIIAIVTGLKDDIRSQIVSLGADILDILPGNIEEYGPGSTELFQSFKKSEVEKIKEQKHLYKYISELYSASGSFRYRDKKTSGFILGVEPDYFKIRSREALFGRLITKADQKKKAEVALIGINVAEKLYPSVERVVGKKIEINGREFRVIGVMEKQDMKFGNFDIDDAIYLPSKTVEVKFESALLREIFLSVPDEKQIPQAKSEFERLLTRIRGKDEFSVLAQEDLLEMVDKIMGMITTALAGLASISLLVGGIGIMNIMLVSVTERTREIGIRKAVGAEDSHILLQFLTESVVLSLIGGILGLGMAFVISLVLERYFGVSSLINVETILGAMGFSVLVGVIFGTAPAYKAAKKDPIEALRYNQ